MSREILKCVDLDSRVELLYALYEPFGFMHESNRTSLDVTQNRSHMDILGEKLPNWELRFDARSNMWHLDQTLSRYDQAAHEAESSQREFLPRIVGETALRYFQEAMVQEQEARLRAAAYDRPPYGRLI